MQRILKLLYQVLELLICIILQGFGVRVDSCIYNGYGVVPYYDSLIGKLIVHAENRKEAISRMNRSLNELVVDGIDTTKDLHKKIISSKSFKKYDLVLIG